MSSIDANSTSNAMASNNPRSSLRKRKPTLKIQEQSTASRPAEKKRGNAPTTTTTNSTRRQQGRSSLKNIFCNGCNQVIPSLSEQDFIKRHSEKQEKCKKALLPCLNCGDKFFYSKKGLDQHFRFSPKCSTVDREMKKKLNYQTSIVPIINTKVGYNTKLTNSNDTNKNTNYTHNNFIVEKFINKALYDLYEQNSKNYYNRGKAVSVPGTQKALTNEMSSHNQGNTSCTKNIDPPVQSGTLITNNSNIDENNENHFTLLNDNDSLAEEYQEDIINNLNNQQLAMTVEINEDSDEELMDDANVQNAAQGNHLNPNNFLVQGNPTQEHLVEIRNKQHLINIKRKQLEEIAEVFRDEQYLDGLNLMKIIMSRGESFSAYQTYMKWKHMHPATTSKRSFMSEDDLVQSAIHRVYGTYVGNKLKPVTKLLTCPSGAQVNVTTNHIDAILYGWFSDPDLMQVERLIFEDGNEDNPFFINIAKTHLSDFNTAPYYINTMADNNDMQNREVLTCPFAAYMDEAVLDSYSKLSFHPVTVCLMIFNRKTRNREMTWKTLGYMPNLSELTGTKSMSPVVKLADFHFILKYILSGIERIQKIGGFEWEFEFDKYPGKKYKRLIKFPLGLWIGDGKGNDAACGKYQSRSLTTHVCRHCDVELEYCDSPDTPYIMHIMNKLLTMSHEELNAISFHKVLPTFAFKDIDFGANPYGINGCTPPDLCHQLNKGVAERLPEILKARITTKMVKKMDVDCSVICIHMRRQSERNLPPIRAFRKGLSSVSKLTAEENIGRLFACFLVLLSRDFESFCVNKPGRRFNKNTPATIITQNEYNKWIGIFEETLLLYAWANLDEHPRVVFNGGKNSLVATRVREYMNLFLATAERREGKGMKLMKWHQLTHWWWVCRMFGSLKNVDSSRNESFHKKKKKIAAKTQRRFNVLDSQTSEQEFKFNVLLKGMKQVGIDLPNVFEMNYEVDDKNNINENNNESEEETENNQEIDNNDRHSNRKNNGSKFCLTFDYDSESLKGEWTTRGLKKREFEYPEHILSSFFHKLKGYNHGQVGKRIKSVECFTEYRCSANSDIVFRCCPKFQNSGDWFDWGIIDWVGEGLLEAQLLLMVDMKTMVFEDYDSPHTNTPHDIISFEKGCLVHSVLKESGSKQREPANVFGTTERQRQQQGIANVLGPVTRIVKFYAMERPYNFIDIQTISLPCFVVSDKFRENTNIHEPGNATHVYSVLNKNSWSNFFIDYSSEDELNQASTQVNDDLQEEDVRYRYES